MVTTGLTGLVTCEPKVASLYHLSVPTEHVALKVDDEPKQIDAGLANAPVGAVGKGVTVTVTGAAGLLHVPFTHAP